MPPTVPCEPARSTRLEYVFVYGTLKRGQCREDLWPRAPVSVAPAWTLGSLFDLGPYPALLGGNDRVLGELWSFEPSEMPAVLAVLDQIEGTNQPGQSNEYDRVQVPVTCWTRGELTASTYCYAAQAIGRQLKPLVADSIVDGQSYVQWPSGVRREPNALA